MPISAKFSFPKSPSVRMPHSFLPLKCTSFGHFMLVLRFAIFFMDLTTAIAAIKVRYCMFSVFFGLRSIDIHNPFLLECHFLLKRPLPLVCVPETTTILLKPFLNYFLKLIYRVTISYFFLLHQNPE